MNNMLCKRVIEAIDSYRGVVHTVRIPLYRTCTEFKELPETLKFLEEEGFRINIINQSNLEDSNLMNIMEVSWD